MARSDSVRASEKEGGDSVDQTPPAFTIDDLVAELRPEDMPDGLTIRELCERAGLPVTNSNMAKVRVKVDDLRALDLWEYVGKKRIRTVSGALWGGSAAFRPKEKGGGVGG